MQPTSVSTPEKHLKGIEFVDLFLFISGRVATVREKRLEIDFFPGQGKVMEFQFYSGKFRKNDESQGKNREFEKFPKNVNW